LNPQSLDKTDRVIVKSLKIMMTHPRSIAFTPWKKSIYFIFLIGNPLQATNSFHQDYSLLILAGDIISNALPAAAIATYHLSDEHMLASKSLGCSSFGAV
jgi:hypothetical protein